jgi:predicted transcriptional regulator
MSKSSIEQITISDILPDVQKLTRNLHLYDSTLTSLHKIFFDYLKVDELECISERVLKISNLNSLNAFQYYSDQVKTALDTDLFRIKCYMETICESVTKEGIKLLHELQAEELARTGSNSH